MKQHEMRNTQNSEKQEMTLLDAIEQIVTLVENSALNEEFFKKADRPIAYVGERMKLSGKQAVLLAILANFYNEWSTLSELTEFVGCKRLQLLHYASELNHLRKSRLIHFRLQRGRETYRISSDAMRAIQFNEDFTPSRTSGLTLSEFFDHLNYLIEQRGENGLEYKVFAAEVNELLSNNRTLPFVEALKALNLQEDDIVLFLWCCDMLVSQDDGVIIPRDFESLYEGMSWLMRKQRCALRDQSSPLIDKGLLRPIANDGMGNPDAHELTPYVRDELLQELGLSPKKRKDKGKNILSYKSISPKKLFYNQKEERSLAQLRSLLEPERFEQICNRLEEKGLRRGFACLFYGAPGTGKTETVLQLARQTERDLIQVNVSEIKSMWVGESEKNIKALFDRYRKQVKESEHAPILFFNEADAIISKRGENVERAVDKMENSIQNIILQEIENLEGILIATTNLTKNMDSAFERRFLYKIEFEKPSQEAKRSIWQSMLPSLSDSNADELAAKYDFSGGQIENIARKQAVEEILTGCGANFTRLTEFCDEELLDSKQPRKRIGF